MNFKALFLTGSLGLALQGCTSLGGFSSDSFKKFQSPQEVIDKKSMNNAQGAAKEYVYYWDPKQGQHEIQSLNPKHYLSAYCSAKGGKLKQIHKSTMQLVKDKWAQKLLATYSSVHQGIGAFQCLEDNGSSWVVSIEPTAERKQSKESETRLVSLQTRLMTPTESDKFYGKKSWNDKDDKQIQKQITQKKDDKKSVDKKVEEKKVEDKKNKAFAVTPPVKVPERVVETPQTQQMKLFVSARKDLSRGQNQINACNNAELAYGYGRLRGSSGINVYAESGVLVARCLINIPAYSRRFSNPKDRAEKILQNLASNYNHAGAKQMLKQLH